MLNAILEAESHIYAYRSSMPWWIRDALNSFAQSRLKGLSSNKRSYILSLNAMQANIFSSDVRWHLAVANLFTWNLASVFPIILVAQFGFLRWRDNFEWYHCHIEGRIRSCPYGEKDNSHCSCRIVVCHIIFLHIYSYILRGKNVYKLALSLV